MEIWRAAVADLATKSKTDSWFLAAGIAARNPMLWFILSLCECSD